MNSEKNIVSTLVEARGKNSASKARDEMDKIKFDLLKMQDAFLKQDMEKDANKVSKTLEKIRTVQRDLNNLVIAAGKLTR